MEYGPHDGPATPWSVALKVLVSHPGVQHAHQLAWALEEAGHLGAFWSGVPVRDSRLPPCRLAGWFPLQLRRVPIPAHKRRHHVIFPLLRRLISNWMPLRLASAWNTRLDHLADAWVARRIGAVKPDLVVCYENSALRTFRAAKAIGAVCVLDAASIHYQAGGEWIAKVGEASPRWVDMDKQREIELADAILTCSDFAAETYRAAGVPAKKLFPVPLGADLPDLQLTRKSVAGPCRFVFVGSLRRLKSVDTLLDVFEAFYRDSVPATLTLIGGVSETDLAARAKRIPNVTHHHFMPQQALFEEVAKHDVLLLPSRFDAFGMVVPEAMAVGTPVLVSDRVGAKCIIEAHPESGWIVPCDQEAIQKQVLELVEHRERVATASVAARSAAQDYSWARYRTRVTRIIEEIFKNKSDAA